MEVHAPTHTPDSYRERKKWTHYFWEFLMLFLAVFCGFLAEYQLEHKIEKERGMQYIRSFYNDLKTDTAEFSEIIKTNEKKLVALQKRKACFDSLPFQMKAYNPCITELMNHSSGFPDLINADQTLLQLKNAGGLRLINQADADSILAYDRMIRDYIKGETTGQQESQYRIRDIINSLINYKNLKLGKEDPAVPFLIPDVKMINKYFVMLDSYYYTCRNMTRMIKQIKQKATDLIVYFKNKYDME
ncbi:MAG TPA: hypothetical protein VJ765_00785 [Chitinophagaceae bacterium]|nr:hypothetical protein [Chitinophagaceae bacterium]